MTQLWKSAGISSVKASKHLKHLNWTEELLVTKPGRTTTDKAAFRPQRWAPLSLKGHYWSWLIIGRAEVINNRNVFIHKWNTCKTFNDKIMTSTTALWDRAVVPNHRRKLINYTGFFFFIHSFWVAHLTHVSQVTTHSRELWPARRFPEASVHLYAIDWSPERLLSWWI